MWMYLVNQLHSGYFGNLNRVENVVDCLFVIDLCQFLLHIYILIVVRFHLCEAKFNILWYFNGIFSCM